MGEEDYRIRYVVTAYQAATSKKLEQRTFITDDELEVLDEAEDTTDFMLTVLKDFREGEYDD